VRIAETDGSPGRDSTGVLQFDDTDNQGTVLGHDCPESFLRTPTDDTLVVLLNNFKSKSGNFRESAARRLRQATRTAQLYEALRRDGHTRIAIVGDFNDTPDSPALRPLLRDTDLRDVSEHTAFLSDGRIGTFGNGTKADKIDDILLSHPVTPQERGTPPEV
jgi:hypothetical protein